MRRSAFFTLLLTCLIGVVGCGGGGGEAPAAGGDGGAGGGGGGALERTVEVATALGQSFADMYASEGWPAASASFATFASTQEYVDEVNVDAETDEVTVIYESGVFHVFHPDDQAGGPATSALGRAEVPTSSSGSGRLIPMSNQATASTGHIAGLAGWPEVEGAILDILAAAENAGYDAPRTIPTADLDWFRLWREQGLVYVHFHGGYATLPSAAGHPRLYYIQTGEHFTSVSAASFAHGDDLTAGRVGFLTVPETREDDTPLRALVVTTRFFEHYCNPMTTGSLVWLNCCHSLEHLGPDSMAGVLTSQGTDVVVGWNGFCFRRMAADLASYGFDRMLGLNANTPQDHQVRPFTFDDVWDYILANRTTSYSSPGSRGNIDSYRPLAAATATSSLVPVISGGYYLPQSSIYPRPFVNLEGYFGLTRGQVFLGGTALVINRWTEDSITADVPISAVDGTNDVVVRVGDLQSNTVRLTEFNGGLDVAVNRPGMEHGTIEIDFRARGLTQLIRDEVDGDPINMSGPFDQIQVYDDAGTIEWDITGDWTDEDGDRHQVEANGIDDLASTAVDPADAMNCILVLDLANPAGPRYQIDLTVIVHGTETITTPEGAVTTQDWISTPALPGYTPPAPLPDSWTIPAGTHTGDGFVMTWSELPASPAHPTEAYPAR